MPCCRIFPTHPQYPGTARDCGATATANCHPNRGLLLSLASGWGSAITEFPKNVPVRRAARFGLAVSLDQCSNSDFTKIRAFRRLLNSAYFRPDSWPHHFCHFCFQHFTDCSAGRCSNGTWPLHCGFRTVYGNGNGAWPSVRYS